MNQSTNKIDIIGVVSAIETRTGATKNGVEYVSGKVLVDTGNNNIVPVDFFATKTKKDGTPNSLYTGINTFINEVKTIVDNGREDATQVEFTGAQISENMFSIDGTTLINTWRISHNFLRRAKTPIEPDKYVAKFVLGGIVANITDEIKDDLPTGKLLIDVISIGYGDSVNVLKLTVAAPDGVAYAKASLNEGDYCKFGGKIEYTEDVEIVSESVGFGTPIEQVKKTTKKQLTVESITNPVPHAENQEELNKALQAREANKAAALDAAKKKAATNASTPAVGKATASSFTL